MNQFKASDKYIPRLLASTLLVFSLLFSYQCDNSKYIEKHEEFTPTVPEQTGKPVTRQQIDDAFAAENDGSFQFSPGIAINSVDESGASVKITGNVFVPKGPASARYPAIIFINSWSLNEYEYIVQAAKFAKEGYITMSYSTRGFGVSGGQINVAGEKDIQDLKNVIKWLKSNTPVDAENIGLAGISYGAGISLLGLAQIDEVKTACAMSGWGDLQDSLWAGESPQQAWGSILILSGYFTGRMDPVIKDMYLNLVKYDNVETTKAWAASRSPMSYVESLNRANKPVYISNNFQDELFNPNQVLNFFEALTVPKRLDLNQGIHATAETAG